MATSKATNVTQKSKLFKTIGTAIVFLIIVSVSAATCVKRESSRIIEALTQLQVIRMMIKQEFNSEQNYKLLGTDGITGNTIAISAGLFPDSMKKGDGASGIKNPWNGNVTLKVATNPKHFSITAKKVPHDACIKLGEMQDWLSITRDSESGASVKGSDASENCKENNTLVFVAD